MCTVKNLISYLSTLPEHAVVQVSTPNPWGSAWETHYVASVNPEKTEIITFGPDDWREGQVYIKLQGGKD